MFWNRKKKPKYKTPEVTDSNFKEMVIDSDKPILLDFYASWCGPCKILSPFIDEISEEFQDKALVAKINVDANPGLVQRFKIKSMPTILFIHDGKIVEKFHGLVPKPNLVEILEEYIAA